MTAALAACAIAAVPQSVAAQEEEAAGSALAAAGGGLIGVVAGGYGNLAIVVLKARYGHYPHSFRDAFGWESTPILVGGGTGVAIGLLRSDLLLPWIIGGSTGLAAGAGIGYVYGRTVWGDSESRWANAAVGAAVGMALGSTVALIRGLNDADDGPGGVEPTVRVPLLQVSF